MGAKAYYNEIDKYCVAWLKNLISAGFIAPGDVDDRSIEDVQPGDLDGYTQCHFFAGIAGWSYALRLAGWPDDRPVWTGSCPCQPFSVAGKGMGASDPRHLRPHFHRLIRGRRPPVVMGEQVAAKAGYGWFDGVASDLAAEGYACRAVDIPACSVNAPHQRNRLYWVAHTKKQPQRESQHEECSQSWQNSWTDLSGGVCRSGGSVSGLGHSECSGDADNRLSAIIGAQAEVSGQAHKRQWVRPDSGQSGDIDNFWREWNLVGPDPSGKYRRLKPGIALLVAGLPARVSKLRAIGNAICPPLAEQVIRAYMETES